MTRYAIALLVFITITLPGCLEDRHRHRSGGAGGSTFNDGEDGGTDPLPLEVGSLEALWAPCTFERRIANVCLNTCFQRMHPDCGGAAETCLQYEDSTPYCTLPCRSDVDCRGGGECVGVAEFPLCVRR